MHDGPTIRGSQKTKKPPKMINKDKYEDISSNWSFQEEHWRLHNRNSVMIHIIRDCRNGREGIG